MEWRPLREGSPLSTSVLWSDAETGAHGRLVKLPAGFAGPFHAHTGAKHIVSISGTWRHTFEDTGKTMAATPGAYVFQPGGGMHRGECVGTEDCIIFLTQSVAPDLIPKQ